MSPCTRRTLAGSFAAWGLALGLPACADTPAPVEAPEPPADDRAPACGPPTCAPKVGAAFRGVPGEGLVTFAYPAQHDRDNARWGAALGDIVRHLPLSYGDTYYDADKVTYGHETSHGIHSHLRNNFNNTGRRANGFYLMDDRAAIVPEPGIRKSQVVPFVPQSLRGSRFGLYLQGSPDWDDTPLYIWDEWNAYVNGTEVAVDLFRAGGWDQGWRDAAMGPLEFTVYAVAVAMAVEAHDPAYFRDEAQFRELLAWNARRAMDLYRAASQMEAFRWDDQEAYHARMRDSADAEPWRAFARRFFGAAWADAVFFGVGDVPDVQPPADPGVEPPDLEPDPGAEPDPGVEPDPSGSDADGDGLVDEADLCSDTPPGAPVWRDGGWQGCGAGQIRDHERPRPDDGPDADADFVIDDLDLCRATPAGAPVWRAGEWIGCAEGQRRDAPRSDGPDLDQDGIGDALDLCSDTPAAARVWRTGEWAGCAGGQIRDREG